MNRPSDVALEEVLEHVGLRGPATADESRVLVGGPVSPQTGWVIFDSGKMTDEEDEEGVLTVCDHLGVSANMEMLERIAEGEGPPRHVMTMGYAGWGPGQLDDEIREGSWIVVDIDPTLVFDMPYEQRWEAALAKLGIDPSMVVGNMVADA